MFPVALLLVVLICPPVSAYSDNFTEAYLLQEKLEKALVDDPDNLYKLQEKFPLGDNPLIKCVPVTYVITETNDTRPVNCTNCTFGYNETFLWTSFNTTNMTGSLLFTWAKSGVRVFGFSDWAIPCKFNATTDGIVLHLNVDEYSIIPDPENILLYILNVITEELKAYAYANGKVPSPEMIEGNRGYAQKWSEYDARAISQGEAIVIAGSITLAVFSFILMIAIVPTVYNKLYKKTQSRKDYTYLYFWSTVPLVYMLIVCAFLYGLTQASATLIFILNSMYIFMVTMLSAFVAVLFSAYYFEKKAYKIGKGIPCPLLCFCKCCLSDFCCHCMNNGCAIFMTYGILVYFMYAFPAIIIAYYVFPSRTLVRLSFIQVAFLILVLTITVFLYLMERTCLLCLLARSQRVVKDPEAATQELINLVPNERDENTSEPSRHTRSATEEGVQSVQQPNEDRHNQHDKPNCESICWSGFKAVVALFGVGITFFLLVVIGMVVFAQSAEGNDRIDQFLTILPTILVNFIVWIFRDELFHLGKTLTEVVIPSRENSATRYGTTPV